MSNINRAAEIIENLIDEPHLYPDGGLPDAAAQALDDAGLLAPDLPKPKWEHMGIWVVDDLEIEAIGDSVNLEWSDETDDMRGTTTRYLNLNRRMILAILAAADRTEEVGTSNENCVFCQKIDTGGAVRDTHSVCSFTPLNPVTEGHRLFIPQEHVEHGDERAPVETSLAIEAAHTYAQAMGENFNLITSSGPAATQTIPHIHIHYVPRRPGDGLTLPWTGQEKTDAQDD